MNQEELRQQILEDFDHVFRGDLNEQWLLELLEACENLHLEQLNEYIQYRFCSCLCLIFQNVTEDNSLILRKTEEVLLKIANEEGKKSVCRIWETSRPPLLEDFIVRNEWLKPANWTSINLAHDTRPRQFVQLALKRGEFAEIDEFTASNPALHLYHSLAGALFNADAATKQAALIYCRQLNQYQRNQISSVLASQNYHLFYDEVVEWLAENKYYPQNQDYARVVISLVNDEFAPYNSETETVIDILIDIAEGNKHADRFLPYKARVALRNLQTVEGRDYLCRRVISRLQTPKGSDELVMLVVEAGYEPILPTDKIFFFFLTCQFDKYDTLDFDRRTMRSIHSMSENQARQRITSIVRESGRVDYLDIITVQAASSNLSVYSQQKAAIKILHKHQQWMQLWQKVFEFSFWGSLGALSVLRKAAWQPATPYEQDLMNKLISITQLGLPDKRLQKNFSRLTEQPLGAATTEIMTTIKTLNETKAELPATTQNVLSYIEIVLRHRFRHDIEVEYAPVVQPTDFDVELESD